MRIFLNAIIFIWATVWIIIGVGVFLETPGQIERDDFFFNKEIKPSIDFVEDFKSTNERLPNYREYYTWARDYYEDYTSDLNQTVDSLIGANTLSHKYIRSNNDVMNEDLSKFKDVDWSKDYAIAVWRGEWAEYYYSWEKEYDGNNYSWQSGLFALIVMVIVGILPFFVWWYLNTRRKKRGLNV